MILPLGLSTLPPNKTGILMARKNELMAGHPKLVATATNWQSLWKISKPPLSSRLSWLSAWGAGTEMPSGYQMPFSQVSLCCSKVVTHTKVGREWSLSKIALLYPPLTSFLPQRASTVIGAPFSVEIRSRPWSWGWEQIPVPLWFSFLWQEIIHLSKYHFRDSCMLCYLEKLVLMK